MDALDYAPTVRTLARRNAFFEEALTPATWSLPAHVSLLTGEYPHDHRVTRTGDPLTNLPLVETLNERGYTTYGVSGNPFFASAEGFADPFNSFWYTPLMLFPRGIDISTYRGMAGDAASLLRRPSRKGLVALKELVATVFRQEHSFSSIGNLAFGGLMQLPISEWGLDSFKFVDHLTSYRPEINTRIIERVVREEATSAGPFFLVANYMDTHFPYMPPKSTRLPGTTEGWTHRQIKQFNQKLFDWSVSEADTDDRDLETLRSLYYGEAKSVDQHVKRILEGLESAGLRDETLIIVTSDHGENLGDPDRFGNRRRGHTASLSDALVRVPVILAHSSIEAREFENPVSTKDISRAIISGSLFHEAGIDISAIRPANGWVLTEDPARGGYDRMLENHPEAPPDLVDMATKQDFVLGRLDDWWAVFAGGETRIAWDGERESPYESAPELLRDAVELAHVELSEIGSDDQLSDEAISRLEDIGYL